MYLVIFMTFVGIIVPGGGYKKYVDIVLGLVLIIVIVSPVAAFFGADTGAEEAVARLLPDGGAVAGYESERFAGQRDRMISDNVNEIVRAQIGALMVGTGYELRSSDVRFLPDTGRFLELRLAVAVQPAQQSPEIVVQAAEPSRPFIRVDRVEVSLRESRAEEAARAEIAALGSEGIQLLRRTISDFYNIDADNIYIEVLN